METTTETKIGIRRAVPHDLPALEGLLRMGFQEDAIPELYANFDVSHVYKVAIDLMEMGLVFVACESVDDRRERIVGTIVLEARPWHWNPKAIHLRSLFIYVAKAYRARAVSDGQTIADAFIEISKAVALTTGAVLLLDTATPSRVEAKDRLFQKHGLITVGGLHAFVPPRDGADTETAEAA
jgi:hypothetical protein